MQRHSIKNASTELNKANAQSDLEKKEVGGNYAIDNRSETIALRKTLDMISTHTFPKITAPKAVLQKMPAIVGSSSLTENKPQDILTLSAPIQQRRKNKNDKNNNDDEKNQQAKSNPTEQKDVDEEKNNQQRFDENDVGGAGGGATGATGVTGNVQNNEDTDGRKIYQGTVVSGGGGSGAAAASTAILDGQVIHSGNASEGNELEREEANDEDYMTWDAEKHAEEQRKIGLAKRTNNRRKAPNDDDDDDDDSIHQTNSRLSPVTKQKLEEELKKYTKRGSIEIDDARSLSGAFLGVLGKNSLSHTAHGSNFRQDQSLEAVIQNILNGIQDRELKAELIKWLKSKYGWDLK